MMLGKWHRFLIVAILSLALVAPTVSMSTGPTWINDSTDEVVIEVGCTCHGGGVPNPAAVIVSVSGVPQSYDLSAEYNFTISLTTADGKDGGFLFWSYGVGTFATDGSGIKEANGQPDAISHSAPGNNWLVTWTAPSEDSGDVSFALAGNAVDGSGLPDEGDAWNILSFFISSPGSTENSEGDELALRTISVGDYESLFVLEKTAEQIEAEHQEELSEKYFEQGNIYYWSTLAILVIASVFQREFYEKKFGGGPPHLDKSIAVPQGIGRAAAAIVLLYAAINMYESGWGTGWVGVVGLLFLWASYGVYRTIIQARAPATVPDML